MYQNSKEYTDDVINKFPHMYKRDKKSNNYFLLELYLERILEIQNGILKFYKSLDINSAKGFVLDKFGNTFNLSRKINENDINFKIRIMAEISKSFKSSTYDVILDVLKIFVDDYQKNIFIFEEGIKKSQSGTIDKNVKNGSYGGDNSKQFFEEKGGNIYIILNKAMSYISKERVKKNLTALGVASGVSVTLDFKYEINNHYYDSVKQNKFIETGVTNTNIITKEGVR